LLDPDILAEKHLPQDIHAREVQLKQIENAWGRLLQAGSL
jgi:hypothetical protein